VREEGAGGGGEIGDRQSRRGERESGGGGGRTNRWYPGASVVRVASAASIVFALAAVGMLGGVRFSIAAAEEPAIRPATAARAAKSFIVCEWEARTGGSGNPVPVWLAGWLAGWLRTASFVASRRCLYIYLPPPLLGGSRCAS